MSTIRLGTCAYAVAIETRSTIQVIWIPHSYANMRIRIFWCQFSSNIDESNTKHRVDTTDTTRNDEVKDDYYQWMADTRAFRLRTWSYYRIENMVSSRLGASQEETRTAIGSHWLRFARTHIGSMLKQMSCCVSTLLNRTLIIIGNMTNTLQLNDE